MKTLPRFHRALVFGAALSLGLAPLTASAQSTSAPQEDAAVRFKKGVELFKEGDYEAALIEFRRANDLAPNYNVLYNIGQVYFQLQDYPNALLSLERYLEEGGKSVTALRRVSVEKDLTKLRARIGSIDVTVSVPDAEITVDDVSIGKSPLSQPVLVSAGRHKIAASKSNFVSATNVLEIAGAESQKVSLDLVENAPAPPSVVIESPKPIIPVSARSEDAPASIPPPIQPEPLPPTAHPKSIPWVGWAVTGGLAAGAIVTGVLAVHDSSELQTLRTSGTASRAELDSAQSKTEGLALATDLLIGGAVIAGGVTLGFTIAGVSSSSDSKPKTVLRAEKSAFTASLGVTPGGVRLQGGF